ncbi:response regulator [Alsobacter soli]|uniref:Response regulator n=1 Tax=Alsobacter soli TaxID=2109933 RepID=A0A2T1HXF6_9HYPH|nr:response regulator [Alsobacter soli]PSC06377.1 response regulator [Alsobacter soli]
MIGTPRFPDMLVLVADQSEFTRRIVRDTLRIAGVKRFIDAADGPSVIKTTLRSGPDMLILSDDLPHLPGIEVARALRRVPNFQVPILLMTAQPSPELIDSALDVGIRDMVSKPLTHSALWTRVDSIVKSGRIDWSKGEMPLMRELLRRR